MFSLRILSRRLYSTEKAVAPNFYRLFPKATGGGKVPTFQIDLRQLRKEYRLLQQIHHPDRSAEINIEKVDSRSEIDSQLLNKAYNTLKSPLLRAQYLLKLNGIDVSSEALKTHDNVFLMDVLEVHDALENAVEKDEVAVIGEENEAKINETIEQLTELFRQKQYEKAKDLVIKLRYYNNIEHAVANWEPGKPISLSH